MRALALLTALSVLAPSPVAAQQPGAPARLKIIVLEGQGAVNLLPSRTAVQPVIEVRDENDNPLEGVTVTFELPASGPGGIFPGGQPSQIGVTNRQGQVSTRGFVPNDRPGEFEILVRAEYQGRTAVERIRQANGYLTAEEARRKRRRWLWPLIIMGSAGAAAGIYFAVREPAQPVPVTIGPPVFGPPR